MCSIYLLIYLFFPNTSWITVLDSAKLLGFFHGVACMSSGSNLQMFGITFPGMGFLHQNTSNGINRWCFHLCIGFDLTWFLFDVIWKLGNPLEMENLSPKLCAARKSRRENYVLPVLGNINHQHMVQMKSDSSSRIQKQQINKLNQSMGRIWVLKWLSHVEPKGPRQQMTAWLRVHLHFHAPQQSPATVDQPVFYRYVVMST